MMHDDDERDRTVMFPTPGGRKASRGEAPQARSESAARSEAPAETMTGPNPLLAVAGPVLMLTARLHGVAEGVDVDALHKRVVAAMRTFERRTIEIGVPPQVAQAAHYVLCATIDDVVLNSPWGGRSIWVTRNIVSTFHTDVVGGDRVFDLLNRLQREPGTYRDVLELLYACLSLGFEGRLRVVNRGQSELQAIRENLARTIGEVRGAYEPDLSPHWRGMAAGHKPLSAALPLWVGVVAAALILAFFFMGLLFSLNGQSDAVAAALADMAPVGALTLDLPPPPAPPRVEAPPAKAAVVEKIEPRRQETGGDRVRKFLEREIAEGLVEVTETRGSIIIRLRGQTMFPSGSASLQESYLPTLKRVARAVETEPGRLIVTGHTDNIPIQGAIKVRFPSNFHLSTARAEAVAAILAPLLSQPGRVSAEGRADAEPVISNATPEGRAANRRIDLIVVKPSAETPS